MNPLMTLANPGRNLGIIALVTAGVALSRLSFRRLRMLRNRSSASCAEVSA